MQPETATFSVQVIPRPDVERTADILGPSSAAALALACVDRDHGGAAQVCRPLGENRLVVIPNGDLNPPVTEHTDSA